MALVMRFAAMFVVAVSIYAQNFSEIRVDRVVAGMRFTEGPVWSREGFLLFSDIPNDKIHQLTPGSKGPEVFRESSNGANGNTFDKDGRLYTCESRTRRVTRTDKKGRIEVLAERWEGKRLNAPNDIVVRRDGHVWFTDPAFGNQAETRELDFYGVFHISPKGELSIVAKPEGRPNGIALSPDGRILYVANSDERNIRAYDLDGKGIASNERVLISGIDGPPDGIRVDEKGNLWVASKSLAVYTREGRQLHKIEIAETPANCAFGDADFQTLYITARTSVYRIRLDVKGAVHY
jgi:gluconolactonase